MFKFLSLFIISIFTYCLHAGTEVGNGGGAIICLNHTNITSVHLLDLYGVKGSFSAESDKQLLFPNVAKFVLDRAYLGVGDEAKPIIKLITKEFYRVVTLARFEKTAEGLPFTFDTGTETEFYSAITYDLSNRFNYQACSRHERTNYAQVAIFSLDENSLVIDSHLWDRMDEINKAALFLHEAIYSLSRKINDDKTSHFTRMLVSKLFSDIPSYEYESLLHNLHVYQ